MKRSSHLAQRLLCMALTLLLTFTASGLADDPPTPAPVPPAESSAPASSGEALTTGLASQGDETPGKNTPTVHGDTPGPSADTATPGTDTPGPSTDTPAPGTDTPGPSTDTPVPDTDTPGPSTDTPAPGTDTPGPSTDTPAPGTDTPGPGTDTPTPSTDTPEPSTEAPTSSPVPTPEDPSAPPVCDIPDCPHLIVDEHGNLTALCPLGEWLLAHPEAMFPGISPMSANVPTNVTLPATGSYTLYRSGTYILTGGSASCKLIVSENCLVVLELGNAQIGMLTLGARCVAELTYENSAIGSLSLPDDASIRLLGQGSLTVGTVGPNIRSITVSGGSVSMPTGIVSANGAQQFSFPAPGSTKAAVGGKAYPYTRPSPDGQAHLWLPPLEKGWAYVGKMNGSTLEVTAQEQTPTPSDSFDLSSGAPLVLVDGATVTLLQTGAAVSQTLLVDKADVTLIMSGINAAPGPVNLKFAREGTLHLSGHNSLSVLDGGANLTGSGSLSLSSLAASSLSISSGLTLAFDSGGAALSGWYSLAVPGIPLTAGTKATLDGKPIALAFCTADPSTALLPKAPASGKAYSAALESGVLVLKTIPQGEQSLVLTNAGLALDRNGTYRITTNGPTKGIVTIDPKVQATVTFVGLDTSGSLQIGRNASITLSLQGSSFLGGGIAMGQGSALTVQGGGALLVSGIAKSEGGLVSTQIKSPANLTLPAPGPIAGTGLKPTVLFISDPKGAAMPNTRIVLKLGRNAPFSATTDRNGMIYLWRSAPLSNVDVVVLSDANTYATVLVGGSGDPDALPTLSNVSVNAWGTISYTASGAAASGVQYYINRPGINMPDTYMAGAGHVLEQLGECNIPGLNKGDLVTFRVFACAKANVPLTADTADGFAFSEQYSFTVSHVRFPFSLEAQHKTYNGKKFSFASGLIPKGASITWFSGSQPLKDAPSRVGRYTAKISIPPGHPDFLPGVTDVTVDILPILVLIRPEESRKVMGKPDPPEFLYTYDKDAMLSGDKVTGPLIRVPGEAPGNYPYRTDVLVAASYYRLEIDPDAPMFFIDFDPRHFKPFDPLARIDPVHEAILFSDGRKLDLITATVQKLNISGVRYGEMITEEGSGKPRPFTPSLRLRSGYDAALLILQAEPELNEDGGYVTDLDGNPVVTGRTLTLTYTHLESMRRQRITHIAFGLNGTFCYLELEELRQEAVNALRTEGDIPRVGSYFAITLSPVTGSAALPEGAPSAQESAALQAPLAQVRLELVNGSRRLDITSVLPSARLLMDVSPALTSLGQEARSPEQDVEETVLGESRQATPPSQEEPDHDQAVQEAADTLEGRVDPTAQGLELARQTLEEVLRQKGCSLSFFAALSHPLDSLLVVPYTLSEAQAMPYTAVLRTRPYLMASLVPHGNGLYGLAFTGLSTQP